MIHCATVSAARYRTGGGESASLILGWYVCGTVRRCQKAGRSHGGCRRTMTETKPTKQRNGVRCVRCSSTSEQTAWAENCVFCSSEQDYGSHDSQWQSTPGHERLPTVHSSFLLSTQKLPERALSGSHEPHQHFLLRDHYPIIWELELSILSMASPQSSTSVVLKSGPCVMQGTVTKRCDQNVLSGPNLFFFGPFFLLCATHTRPQHSAWQLLGSAWQKGGRRSSLPAVIFKV